MRRPNRSVMTPRTMVLTKSRKLTMKTMRKKYAGGVKKKRKLRGPLKQGEQERLRKRENKEKRRKNAAQKKKLKQLQMPRRSD